VQRGLFEAARRSAQGGRAATKGLKMDTVRQVMAELERKGSAQTRKILLRHGIPENTYGVKIADLRVIAKKIKGNQPLAYALYETGNYDAMYLAGLVADGSQMTKRQLDSWVKASPCPTISDYTVPGVAVQNEHARDLAVKWINSKKVLIASSGWCTYAGILATRPDDELDLDEIQGLLDRVVKQIDSAPDPVRYVMNGFVIAVGTYVKPLLAQAKRAARAIGVVSVDMGETGCKVPVATEYIQKVEKMGRVGKKRKSFGC
jgi:3-methyladenine DNA glycosylase AlkD